MAEQVSLIQFKGKLAQTVGFRGQNGKNLLRERLTSIANPQTQAQMEQRARFKLTAQLSSMLGTVGQTILRANGYKTTARGELNKMIIPNVLINGGGKAEHNYQLDLIKNTVSVPYTVYAHLEKSPNQFYIAGLPMGTLIAKTVMLYDVTTQKWETISDLSTKNYIAYSVPADSSIENIAVYAYAVAILPITTEGAARLKSIAETLPTTSKGYQLAINRLDNENVGYTQVISLMAPSGSQQADEMVTIVPTTKKLPDQNFDVVVYDASTMSPIENFDGTIKINDEAVGFTLGKIKQSYPKFTSILLSDLVFDQSRYELNQISAAGETVTLPFMAMAGQDPELSIYLRVL